MKPQSDQVTVSVVQAGSVLLNSAQTLEKLADYTSQARATGAQFVLFPEAFLGGYPKGELFGISLGKRTPAGREIFRKYFEQAISTSSREMEHLANITRENGVYLVTGVIEREGGTLYCSVFFFGPDGTYLGKHRKLMPTALERAIWGCGDGSTLTAIKTPYGVTGAAICWENYMPLLRTTMYAQGVSLYCAPTVDDRDSWIPSMQHIASEGRCFVLSACQYLPGEDESSPGIRGGSCIVSPFGTLLAGPVYGEETVLTVELDLQEIVRGKFDLDVTGHYARPDIFQLIVNEQRQQSVRIGNEIEG